MNLQPGVEEKIKKIRLLVLDVDGVMTDGSIWMGRSGELKQFNVHDGAGIKYLLRSGINVAIISGRSSQAVTLRAQELGIKECIQGCHKKLPDFLSLMQRLGETRDTVAFMGDDLTDLPLFNHSGLRIAPQDAMQEIKDRADLVTNLAGGDGAVREAAEILLKIQGKWESLLEAYLAQ